MVAACVWRVTASGLGLGLPLGGMASQGATGLLYGVTPADPAAYVVAAVILAGVAGVAGALPAHRAARLDPTIALRHE